MRSAVALFALAGLVSAPLAALADQPQPAAPTPGPPPPPAPPPAAAGPAPPPALPPLGAAPPAQADSDAPVKAERISLSTAIQRALARNPTVVVAMEEVRRSQAIVREVRAASFPTLTGNGTYQRYNAPALSAVSGLPPPLAGTVVL